MNGRTPHSHLPSTRSSSPRRRTAGLLALGIVATSCSESTTAEAGTSGSDAVARTPAAVAGGVYQLSVVAAQDGCLEGALELVFKPNGGAEPYALQNQTILPGPSSLPAQGVIELEAPFSAMPVTWESGDAGALVIRGGAIDDVLLGLASSPDCTADLVIDVDVTPSTAGVDVAANVTLSGVTSPTETCPVIAEGCLVSLQMVGVLVSPGTPSR